MPCRHACVTTSRDDSAGLPGLELIAGPVSETASCPDIQSTEAEKEGADFMEGLRSDADRGFGPSTPLCSAKVQTHCTGCVEGMADQRNASEGCL